MFNERIFYHLCRCLATVERGLMLCYRTLSLPDGDGCGAEFYLHGRRRSDGACF
jgi:hypothetical protein